MDKVQKPSNTNVYIFQFKDSYNSYLYAYYVTPLVSLRHHDTMLVSHVIFYMHWVRIGNCCYMVLQKLQPWGSTNIFPIYAFFI
jgi:hypothetical protein